MDTSTAIGIIAVLYFIYLLLIKGYLFKIILGIFGWFGMYWYLGNIKIFQSYPLNNDVVSWAFVLPTILVLLSLATTKES